MFAVVMFATCLPVIWYVSYCHIATCLLLLLVHDAFIRTNRCTIAMMFVYLSICLSVWDRRALGSHGALCTDLILQLNSPMSWAP